MDELHVSHSCSKERRAGAAQSKHQKSRVSYVPKGAAGMMSPCTSPSPTSPFVHLDSPSTASMSHLASRSHASAHNSSQPNSQHCVTLDSDASSASECHILSPPREVPIHNVSPQGVSLEQHLRHGDAGREEAMQSFILERFLPAAKTVAADHDCTMFSASRHPITASSSRAQHVSSAIKTAPERPKKFCVSKDVPRFHSVYEGYDDSVHSEMPAKSFGFLCAGLKSAMRRPHVHTSTQSVSRNNIRKTQSCSHRTSSDEDDLLPKVKVMMQGTQKQRGIFGPAPTSLTPSTPSFINNKDTSPRHAAILNKSFARYPAGNCVESLIHCNTRPSLNRRIKCHSSSSLHQTSRKEPSLEDGIAIRQNVQISRCICLGNDGGVGCDHHNTQQRTPVQQKASDYREWNASIPQVSIEDLPSQAEDVKESLDVSGGALKDRCCAQDDELEFYDASSAFDTSISTQSNVPPLEECKVQSQDAQVFLTNIEHNLVDTDCSCIREVESFFDADHESQVEVPWKDKFETGGKESLRVQQTGRINSRQGNARPLNGACSSVSYSREKNTSHEYDKSSSSTKPGWPLGISSFQSGIRKARPQEAKNFSDECAAHANFQSANMAEEQRTLSGRWHTSSNNVCANTEEGTKHCEKGVAKRIFSLDVLAPPVPPSPTTSSWLGKVLASKASKASHLTTLRQEEKIVSAQKVDFTLPSEKKKEVRWEDVVKGSQMYPEHFSFSEEICHHHPANQDAIKPLTL